MMNKSNSDPHESPCERFAPLMSALLDNELGAEEKSVLDIHLVHCPECQDRMGRFKQTDAVIESWCAAEPAVQLVSLPPTHDMTKPVTERAAMPGSLAAQVTPGPPIKIQRGPTPHSPRTWSRFALRMIPAAVAATVLICLALTAFNTPQQADAEQVTPEQIVQPLKQLHWINQQQQLDQQRMLRTLEMDLRFLKIEISGLDPESDERQSLESHIDRMIQQVNQFESDMLNPKSSL